jgi:hypothetical protein
LDVMDYGHEHKLHLKREMFSPWCQLKHRHYIFH